jgi:hypothetical protein
LQQQRRLAVKVEREKTVVADLPELAVRILDDAGDQGRVTMRGMVRATGASSNTLKEHFRNLDRIGLML